MPSLPFRSAKKDKGKAEDASQNDAPTNAVNSPPPAYSDSPPSNGQAAAEATNVDITAAFSTLSLQDTPQDPGVDTCLAHLKLLFALQSLKEDVGYTDGLWNIWDSRADDPGLDLGPHGLPESLGLDGQKPTPEDLKKIKLSKIREKRWALYVARAVDRYEAWWSTFPTAMLREDDMRLGSGALYHGFVDEKRYTVWSESMLPPLDVLMVWHAHMLNPRAFLEDTLRRCLSSFWASGMPWRVVSAAIDTNFSYNVSDGAKASWVAKTGRNWDNIEDGVTKSLKCPACKVRITVPWSTCGQDETTKSTPAPGLVGNGYGDGDFLHSCPGCGIEISKTLLSVAKFVKDVKTLLVNSITMPGTILHPTYGMTTGVYSVPLGPLDSRLFPNRLVRKLCVQITELIKPGMHPAPTMIDVREMVEKVLTKPSDIRAMEGVSFKARYQLPIPARICVRKLMSQYWENFSPFALDLAGAVMRQSIFTAKMHQIDWLHSPACRETMARLINKYDKFMVLIQSNPNKTCVPTLDIDLAWHTHQLSPSAYYRKTTKMTNKFIDHDDKIEEDKLSDSFEWTTRAYQERYSEVYSECTCWYCETIRSSSTGSLSRVLGVSTQEKVTRNFYDSGQASLCPPDKSAHISAHNAVRQLTTSAHDKVRGYSRERQHRQLELNYEKACKRAEKKGRKLPPREQYYDHWGYQYYMYSPFIYPMYFTPGLYYGWDPGFVSTGAGSWANCAIGSCSGGVAAGACGGPGGCGGSGAGGASFGGCGSGGGGGGGGGCGGGGGGCGGGGGGGGGCGGGGGGGGGCGGGG